jgi:signal transduction histidine kinase
LSNTDLPPLPDDPAAWAALTDAALAIAAEHELDQVLQTAVDRARQLVQAHYAALGLAGVDGRLARLVVSGMDDAQVAQMKFKPTGRGILGLLLTKPETLRLTDLSTHPNASGFPPHHPHMTSFLGVPLTVRENTLGALYLTDKIEEGPFSERDEWLVQQLAAHVAVAIENAYFYQRLRQRTVLEERERIGMDLHDGIIQSIYAVGLSLELGRMVLEEKASEAEDHIRSAIEGLDNIIRDLRSYIMDLQPGRIQDEPLSTALERLVREFRANTLVQVSVEVADDIEDELADHCRLALFHITQEALANVAKHAHASRVTVKLDRLDGWVVLSVEDDGAGFDSDNIGGIPGHGLSNMAVRAHSLGGNLTVTSAPGHGTRVQAVMPIQAAAAAPPTLVSFP